MNRKVYIDGNVVVEHGIFYSKEITVFADETFKTDADEVICPPNDVLRIAEDYGSIFTSYYIKGDCACYGYDDEDGNALIYYVQHENTYNGYKNNIRLLERMIDEVEVPDGLKNIYYQQQYVSVFGALEYFLFETFMGQVCNNYDIYIKVLSSHLRCLEYNNEIAEILRGEHDLNQEKLFIEQAKAVIYHNSNQVSKLFLKAFDILVDLEVFRNQINERNDIVHRFGHTKKGGEVHITKDKVSSLIAKIDILVKHVANEIKKI